MHKMYRLRIVLFEYICGNYAGAACVVFTLIFSISYKKLIFILKEKYSLGFKTRNIFGFLQ